MNRRTTLIYSIIQMFFWSGWAALLGFSSTFLLSVGLSSLKVGILMGCCSLASALLQPLLAGAVDRAGTASLKRVIPALSFLSIGFGIFLLRFSVKPMTAGILFGICAGIIQLMSPFLNAMASSAEGTDFGIARGIGSAGYALVFPFIGQLCEKWSTNAVIIAAILGFAGTAVFTLFFPAADRPHTETRAGQENGSFAAQHPAFMVTLSGVLLLYISHVLLGNYGYQIVLSKGGNSIAFGNGGSIAACAELPVMFLFALLLKKKPASFWVRITGFSFFLKAAVILLTKGISAYYAAMLFQLTGWGLIQVASVYYVNEAIEPENAVRGQSMFTSALAMATVIGSFAGGWLIDTFSVHTMIAVAAAAAGIGACIVFLSLKSSKEAGHE